MFQPAWPHTRKPARGALVDWTNPLARGLFLALPLADGAGAPWDVAARLSYALEGGASWEATPSGRGLSCAATGAGAYAILPPALQFTSYPVTIACGFAYGGGTPTANANIFGLLNTASGSGAINNARISWDPSGSTVGWLAPNLGINGGSGYPPPVGVEVAYGLTLTPGGSPSPTAAFYVDGVPRPTVPIGVGGAPSWTATGNVSIGNIPGLSARSAAGIVTWGFVWSRALTADEHARLAAAPWQLLAPRPLYIPARTFRPWIFGDQIEATGLG